MRTPQQVCDMILNLEHMKKALINLSTTSNTRFSILIIESHIDYLIGNQNKGWNVMLISLNMIKQSESTQNLKTRLEHVRRWLWEYVSDSDLCDSWLFNYKLDKLKILN